MISARAIDRVTGEVLEDAVMSIGCRLNPDDKRYISVSTVSAASGMLEAEAPPPRVETIVRIDCTGFTGRTRRVASGREGSSVEVGDVHLWPSPCMMQGSVTDVASSFPVSDVTVTFRDGTVETSTLSGEDGRFSVEVVPGRYVMELSSAKCKPFSRPVTVPRLEAFLDMGSVHVKLVPLTVRVVATSWEGNVRPERDRLPVPTEVELTGRFTKMSVNLDSGSGVGKVDAHPLDTYRGILRVPNYHDNAFRLRTASAEATVDCSELTLVTLPVTFRLVDAKYGSPAAGIHVRAVGPLVEYDTDSRSDGEFTLAMPNCPMNLVTSHAHYDEQSIEWAPPETFFAEAAITAEKGGGGGGGANDSRGSVRRLPSRGSPSRSINRSRGSLNRSSGDRVAVITVKAWLSLVRVSGTVLADGKSPVDGTIVQLRDRKPAAGWDPVVVNTCVAERGAVMARMYPGVYDVTVRAPGCETVKSELTVAPGRDAATIGGDVRAFRRACQVLALDEDRSPLPQVEVTVDTVHGKKTIMTDDRGLAACELIGPTRVSLRHGDEANEAKPAEPRKDGPTLITAVVKAGSHCDIDHVPRGRMHIVVRDAKYRTTVEGVHVTFDDGFQKVKLTTDRTGLAEATVPLWTQWVTLACGSYAEASTVAYFAYSVYDTGSRELPTHGLVREAVTIRGTVKGDGKVPVPGSKVTLSDVKPISGYEPYVLELDDNSGGAYEKEIYPGPYRVTVEVPGCENQSFEVDIQKDSDWSAPNLAPRMYRRAVLLRVMTEGNVASVAGATVAVKTLLGTTTHKTDELGTAKIEIVGPTTLEIDHAEHGKLEYAPEHPTSDERGMLVVTYGDPAKNAFGQGVSDIPKGTAVLEFVDRKTPSKGLANVRVSVDDGVSKQTVTTDASGRARVSDVAMWGCTVAAELATYLPHTQKYVVDSTAVSTRQHVVEPIVLSRSLVALSGNVLRDGAAVSEALVTLRNVPADDWSEVISLDESKRGKFSIELYPGEYTVHVESAGCWPLEQQVTMERQASVTLKVKPCVRQAQAFVLDARSQQPVDGAVVTVTTIKGQSEVTTAHNGRCVFTCVGPTTAVAARDGYSPEELKPTMTSDKPSRLTFAMKNSKLQMKLGKPPHTDMHPDANQTVFAIDHDATKKHGKVHDPAIVDGAPYFIAPMSKPQRHLSQLAGNRSAIGVQPKTGAAAARRFRMEKRPEGSFALLLDSNPSLALDAGDAAEQPFLADTVKTKRSQWFDVSRDTSRGGTEAVARITSVSSGKALSSNGATKDRAQWATADTGAATQQFVLVDASTALVDGATVALVPRHAQTQRVGVSNRSGFFAASESAGTKGVTQTLIVHRCGNGWRFEIPGTGKLVTASGTAGRTPLCAAAEHERLSKRQTFDALITDDGYMMLQSRASGRFVTCSSSGKAGLGVGLGRGQRALWQQFQVVPATTDEDEGAAIQLEPLFGPAAGTRVTPSGGAGSAVKCTAAAEPGSGEAAKQTFRPVPADPGLWRFVPLSDSSLALTKGKGVGGMTVEPLDKARDDQVFGMERVDDDGPTVRLVTPGLDGVVAAGGSSGDELVVGGGDAADDSDDSDKFKIVAPPTASADGSSADGTSATDAAKAGQRAPVAGALYALAPRGHPACRVNVTADDKAEVTPNVEEATLFEAQPATTGENLWSLAPLDANGSARPHRLEAGDPVAMRPADGASAAQALRVEELPDGSMRIAGGAEGGEGVLDGRGGAGKPVVVAADAGDDTTGPAFDLLTVPPMDAASHDAGDRAIADGNSITLVPLAALDKRVGVDATTGRVRLEEPDAGSSGQRFRLSKTGDGRHWHIEPATSAGRRLTATKGTSDGDVTSLAVRGAEQMPRDASQQFDIRELPDGSIALVVGGNVQTDPSAGTVTVGPRSGSPNADGGDASLPPESTRFEAHRAQTDSGLEDGATYFLAPASAPLKRIRVTAANTVTVGDARGTRGECFKVLQRPHGAWALQPITCGGRVLAADPQKSKDRSTEYELRGPSTYDRDQWFRVRAGSEPGVKTFESFAASASASWPVHDSSPAPRADATPGLRDSDPSVVSGIPATPVVTHPADNAVESGGIYTIAPNAHPNLRFAARGDAVVAEALASTDAAQQFVLTEISPGKWTVEPRDRRGTALAVAARGENVRVQPQQSTGPSSSQLLQLRDGAPGSKVLSAGAGWPLAPQTGGAGAPIVAGGGSGDVGDDDAAGGGDTVAGPDSDVVLDHVPDDIVDGCEYYLTPMRSKQLRLRAPLEGTITFETPTDSAAERFRLTRSRTNPNLWTIAPSADACRFVQARGAALRLGDPQVSGHDFRLERAASADSAAAPVYRILMADASSTQQRDGNSGAPASDTDPNSQQQVRSGGSDDPQRGGQPLIGNASADDAFVIEPCDGSSEGGRPSVDDLSDGAGDGLIDGAIYELFPRPYPDQRWSVCPPHEHGSPIEVTRRTGGLEQKFRARRRPDGRWSFVPLVPATPGHGCLEREEPSGFVVRPENDDHEPQAFDIGPLVGNPPVGPVSVPPGSGEEIVITPPDGGAGNDDLQSGETEPSVGTLRVPVADPKTREPLANVSVMLDDSFSKLRGATDASGIVTFQDVPLWPYVATLERKWFNTASGLYVTVPVADVPEFDAETCFIRRDAVTVSSKVLSSLTGNPAIPGATVTLTDKNPRDGFPNGESSTTASGGTFNAALYPGSYELRVEAANCNTYTAEAVVKPCDELGRNTMSIDPIKIDVITNRCAGTVVQADSGKPLSGARIEFKSPLMGSSVAVTSSSDGKFELAEAPPQSTLTVTATRQSPSTVTMPNDAAERENMSIRLDGVPCTVRGVVRDGTTSSVRGIAGATIKCGSTTATSDGSGRYSIQLPQGDRTIEFTGGGCYPTSYPLTLTGDTTQDAFMCPRLTGTQAFRFILRWNSTPSDLDMHMRAASGNATIYWSKKTIPGVGANLDCDVTNGYGPETITVTNKQQHLMLSIHNYSGSPGWDKAGACVDVYTEGGHQQTIRCDTRSGPVKSDYWYVCDTINGAVDVKNKLVKQKP